jgi:S-adenosylmethionine:diacylglycerol 3-amino-3-carboxypropyl transferase
LNPSRDIYTIAHNVIWHQHNVAQMDANPMLKSLSSRQGSVLILNSLLDFDRGLHSFDRTCETHQESIAGAFRHEYTVLLCDLPNQFRISRQNPQSPRFIHPR